MPSRRAFGFLGAGIAAAAVILGSLPSGAHPADMIFQAHDVKIEPGGLSLKWTLRPGPLIVPYIWNEADADGGGAVDAGEARRWIEAHLGMLEAALDGKQAPLEIRSLAWPSSFEKFQVGDEAIEVALGAAWPDMQPGEHTLGLTSAYESRISSYWFSVCSQGMGFHAPEQAGGLLELSLVPGPGGSAKGKEGLMHSWESGTPALPGIFPAAGKQPGAAQGPVRPGSLGEVLSNAVRSGKSTLSFFLFALAVALLLGALHALAPGHGKTIVAAYLVGSRGTVRHAAALGGIVTLTHTGSFPLSRSHRGFSSRSWAHGSF
jgi:nickel/cobalt exporter